MLQWLRERPLILFGAVVTSMVGASVFMWEPAARERSKRRRANQLSAARLGLQQGEDVATAAAEATLSQEVYTQVYEAWKSHVSFRQACWHRVNEAKDSSLAYDTHLAEDVVVTEQESAQVWRGREGCATHWRTFGEAFGNQPGMELLHVIVGPQGVHEEWWVTGTHTEAWLGYPASGREVCLGLSISLKWNGRAFEREAVFVGAQVDLGAESERRLRQAAMTEALGYSEDDGDDDEGDGLDD